jgi:ribonuclease-3
MGRQLISILSFFGSLFKNNSLTQIEKKCEYRFKDRSYLDQAFSHRSISAKPRENYERLEFLGDAVIDIVVSRELMREFPEGDEGIKIEPNVDLSQDKIALKQAANLYEALIGAIYLDGGINSAKKVILSTVWSHRELAWKSVNHKGKLIELCHTKHMENPRFLVSNVSGPEHKKLFEVKVKIGNNFYPSGIGSNKKIAEQHAAQLAIDSIND